VANQGKVRRCYSFLMVQFPLTPQNTLVLKNLLKNWPMKQ